jgi:hypothetical protein
MLSRIPEAMSEPNALLNIIPHERRAVRKPSSLCLYHFERRNKAPYLSVRICVKRSPMVAYWEKRALANAQEETRHESADKVVGSSSQDGDETPKGHADGEVYGGPPNMIEEHVPISS